MAETGAEKQVHADSVPNGSLAAQSVGGTSVETNDPKKENTSRVLSEGIILVVLTAAAYVATFAYEFGYAFQFNIPTELITVSVQNLVYCGAILCACIFLGYKHLRMLLKLSEPVDDSQQLSIYQLFMLKWGVIVIICIIIMMVSRFHWITWVAIGTLSLFVLKDLWHPHVSPGPPRREAMIRSLKSGAKDGWELVDPQAQRASVYVFLAVVTVSFFGLMGFGEARGRTVFPFLGDTNEAILRRYGDILVIGRFDLQSGYLLSEFRVVKADELKERIIMKRVGAAWPVTVKWQDIKALQPPGADRREPVLPDVELSAQD